MTLLVSKKFILKTWLRIFVIINLQVVMELLRGLQLRERTTVSNVVERAREAVGMVFAEFNTANTKQDNAILEKLFIQPQVATLSSPSSDRE